MVTINVSANIEQTRRMFSNLSKEKVAKATSQAINQTLLLGRTQARKAVKEVYDIPQKNLSGINIKRSTYRTLTGIIYASTKPIPMDAFSPRFEIVSSGSVRGIQSISRRGIQSTRISNRRANTQGVSVEIKKGQRVVIPYAFLLPGAKPRVFARGHYQSGNGSYGFLQRHTREEYAGTGNDSVKPLASVTVFGAIMNPATKLKISNKVSTGFEANLIKALRRQAGTL